MQYRSVACLHFKIESATKEFGHFGRNRIRKFTWNAHVVFPSFVRNFLKSLHGHSAVTTARDVSGCNGGIAELVVDRHAMWTAFAHRHRRVSRTAWQGTLMS